MEGRIPRIGMLRALLVVAGLGSTGPSARAEPTMDLREGDWETKGETKMEGLPIPMPSIPFKMVVCVLKEDLVPRTDKKSCTVSEQQVSGNTVTWKSICTEKGKTSESSGTITYDRADGATSYEGTVESVTPAGRGSMKSVTKLSAHRVGDCSDKSRAEREQFRKAAAAK